ncbi:hypothetical protein ACN47E_006881 [Coniothyrium glycines]
MSRSTSTSSTTIATTHNGLSRTMSVKTNTKAQSLNPLPASDVRLFVTNLRLLDFDLRDDWPGITVHTFSGKNADQKQRISGSEWALFRLFELWDADETGQKLQPFFPPLEPLQSLNLRAALYRSLNELKKNGVLGRESVLRKTMLDECKGEKFYEILVLFSTAVLKKVLAERSSTPKDGALARTLATASTLPLQSQQSLLPLAIAHKVALVRVLKQKEEKRRRYLEFERLLNNKSDDNNRRIRQAKDSSRAKQSTISQKETDFIKKQLQDNWIGDQKWLDVMLHGDQVQPGDAFLGASFDKVWRMVEAGRGFEDAAPEMGLLQSLQLRVSEQATRLQKWKEFHEELQKEKSQTSTGMPAKSVATVKHFAFDSHLRYQLPPSKQHMGSSLAPRPKIGLAYQTILWDLDEELLQVSKVTVPRPAKSFNRRRTSSSEHQESTRRPRWSSKSAPIQKPYSSVSRQESKVSGRQSRDEDIPLPESMPPAATPADSEATLVDRTSALRHQLALPSGTGRPPFIEPTKYHTEPTPPTSDPILEPSSPSPLVQSQEQHEPEEQYDPVPMPSSPVPSPKYPSEPPIPAFAPPELNPEEVLAEQIITSIGNATPSPVKKPQKRMSLSLVERTRMSMARTTSFEPLPESPDLPILAAPLPPPAESPDPDPNPDPDHRATLLERTRVSMLAMQSRPRKSLAAAKKEKRKSRQSLFPVNQFDTPRTRKSSELIEERRSIERTPTEVLFDDTVDYDRVFKSRPRIATSPVFSPPQEGGYAGEDASGDEEVEYDDDITGIDLGDVDQDDEDEDGFTKTWADSPSRRAGAVRY